MAVVEHKAVENARGIDGLREAIAEIGTRMDSRFDTVDRRFEAIDRRFEAIDRRFETMELRADNPCDRVLRELTLPE